MFKSSIRFKKNWVEGSEILRILLVPTLAQLLPLSKSGTIVLHLLQLINIHWHIMITQSPSFTLDFILGILHPVGFTMYDRDPPSQYHTECFPTLKILCALPFHHSLLPNAWQLLILFAFSRMSYNWNYSFSELLLLLSNMHLCFFPVFSWLNSSFVFIAE